MPRTKKPPRRSVEPLPSVTSWIDQPTHTIGYTLRRAGADAVLLQLQIRPERDSQLDRSDAWQVTTVPYRGSAHGLGMACARTLALALVREAWTATHPFSPHSPQLPDPQEASHDA